MPASLDPLVAGFDPDLPLERAHTVPAAWYCDPAVYDLERTAILGDSWQVAGRSELVGETGSFLTTAIAGVPILVVRDQDGTLRAFVNVCRHRAAPVVTAECGNASRLRCRYHGWTYDLAGRLHGTPEFDGVLDFARDDNGLLPLSTAIWGPLVWVHAGKQPPPLAEFLAPLPDRVAGKIETLRFVERRMYDLACNWKVYVDNYLDGGYHVNTVHPGLAGVLDYRHYRTELAEYTSVQISPLKPASTAGNAAVAAVRGGAEAMYWFVFPNFMLNLYEGVMDTNLVLPLGPEHCRVVFDFYFADTGGAAEEHFRRESLAVAERIQQEDMGICEEVQRGLASGSFHTGRFSVRREAAGYHFHQLLGRKLQSAACER